MNTTFCICKVAALLGEDAYSATLCPCHEQSAAGHLLSSGSHQDLRILYHNLTGPRDRTVILATTMSLNANGVWLGMVLMVRCFHQCAVLDDNHGAWRQFSILQFSVCVCLVLIALLLFVTLSTWK